MTCNLSSLHDSSNGICVYVYIRMLTRATGKKHPNINVETQIPLELPT